MKKTTSGFTIVELLIVIVVIAILAAVTIVAYNGIQDRARASAAQSAAGQVAKKAAAYVAQYETCPADLATIGVTNSNNVAYQYSCSTNTNPATFCVTSVVANQLYYVDSAVQPKPASGTCSTYNYLLWDKTTNVTPVPGGTVDTSVYRTSSSSIRLGPNQVQRSVLNSPYSGSVGQTYTMSLWIRSDSNWNGTSGNSKIRFGAASNGALLNTCSYEGVKTTWTFASCSFTLTSTDTSVGITVGNDGTVGSIWLDDLTLTRSY